ncbi:MAG: LacI family DNA-binding transcriptional regulator [Phycisphaerales bacterium]
MTTVNQTQIAASLGLSCSTVSYVLAGKAKEKRISEDVVIRIRQAVDRVNYKPHGLARSLVQKKTGVIGILLRNAADRPFENPPVLEFIVGINTVLEPANYIATLVRIGDLRAEGEPQSRVFNEHLLDGIIAIGHFDPPLIAHLRRLSPLCIWVDGPVFEPQRCLRRDEEHAGRLAAQKAVEAGYRRLVYVGTQTSAHYSAADRPNGIKQFADASHPPIVLERAVSFKALTPELRRFFSERMRPDVAFITDDSHTAMRLITVANVLGRRIGTDFGLASCDNWNLVDSVMPELGRVAFDRLSMGTRAARMLLNLIDDPDADCPSAQVKDAWVAGASLTPTSTPVKQENE